MTMAHSHGTLAWKTKERRFRFHWVASLFAAVLDAEGYAVLAPCRSPGGTKWVVQWRARL